MEQELMEKTDITTQIVEFVEFDKTLAEYKELYVDVVYALDDPDQMKMARSDKLAIGKTVSKLDKRHKEIKAPLQAHVTLLDGERKRIKDGLRDIQEDINVQIESHEAAIKAVDDELLRRASSPRDLTEFDTPPTINLVRERLEAARAFVVDETLGDREAYAALNKMKAIETLEPLLLGLEAKAEADEKAERERLEEAKKQQELRDERIAKEAEDRAKAEAEETAKAAAIEAEQAVERERQAKLKAEADAKEAVERERKYKEINAAVARTAKANAAKALKAAKAKAARDKAAAVEKAKAESKAAAARLEQSRLDAEAKEAAATAKREANKKHNAAINNAAAEAIWTNNPAGLTIEQAKDVVIAIAKKQIPNVSIAY
jgi:colicin import membrane protein